MSAFYRGFIAELEKKAALPLLAPIVGAVAKKGLQMAGGALAEKGVTALTKPRTPAPGGEEGTR